MHTKLIAIVDDEKGIIDTLSEYLLNKGFSVEGFPDSRGLFDFLEQKKPDLIILDLQLPGMSGLEICRALKENERHSSIPVIILSANSDENNKVSGLDLGADDYIVKPFSLNEMNSRIKAVLRRQKAEEGPRKVLVSDKMVIDLQKYEVTVDGEKVRLTSTEFKILERLASLKGQVLSRDMILEYLWGNEKIVVDRTIDVHIRHLREKLGSGGDFIKNIRGVGYKLDEEG